LRVANAARAVLGYSTKVDFIGNIRIEIMTAFDRITIDPTKMNGQPCIRGMRLTVRRVLEGLALYPDRLQLAKEYPELEDEDIRQSLAYAAAHLDDKVLELHGVQ
jgi:uncharacterized protein (DUF433 family)